MSLAKFVLQSGNKIARLDILRTASPSATSHTLHHGWETCFESAPEIALQLSPHPTDNGRSILYEIEASMSAPSGSIPGACVQREVAHGLEPSRFADKLGILGFIMVLEELLTKIEPRNVHNGPGLKTST